MQHLIDAGQAWIEFRTGMNVENLQFIGRNMGPGSGFLSVGECGDLEQGGKEFI